MAGAASMTKAHEEHAALFFWVAWILHGMASLGWVCIALALDIEAFHGYIPIAALFPHRMTTYKLS